MIHWRVVFGNSIYYTIKKSVLGNDNMEIGKKITDLRKNNKLSQEDLAEKLGVTRQTISKWELGQTYPSINQAKELSKIFNISLDELVNNDIKNLLVEKTSNTEKLAGIIINILKVIGILFVIFIAINLVLIVIFNISSKSIIVSNVDSVKLNCRIDNNNYLIEIGSDGYFNCSNCTKELQLEIKDNYVDFSDINKTAKTIEKYFDNNNGMCD